MPHNFLVAAAAKAILLCSSSDAAAKGHSLLANQSRAAQFQYDDRPSRYNSNIGLTV